MNILIELIVPIIVALVIYYILSNLPKDLDEKLRGWKQMIMGAFGAIMFAVLEILQQAKSLDLNSILPANSAVRVGFYMSLLIIVLRVVTTTAFGKKE